MSQDLSWLILIPTGYLGYQIGFHVGYIKGMKYAYNKSKVVMDQMIQDVKNVTDLVCGRSK